MIVRHNAGSESTKPYKTEYEYIAELKVALNDHPHLRVLWIGGGCYDRGDWDDYDQTIAEMLFAHPNLCVTRPKPATSPTQSGPLPCVFLCVRQRLALALTRSMENATRCWSCVALPFGFCCCAAVGLDFSSVVRRGRAGAGLPFFPCRRRRYISITPFHLACSNVMGEECWIALCEKFPTRFMVGTSVRGKGGNEYMKEWLDLIRFLAKLSPDAAEAVRYTNAVNFYRRTDNAALKAQAMTLVDGAATAPPGAGLRQMSISGPLVERSLSLHIDTAEVTRHDCRYCRAGCARLNALASPLASRN